MQQSTDTIQVYVGTYAKYNNGSIQGKWLDLTDYSDKESFLEACAELHNDEVDPEFMYQDYEGFPSEFYSEADLDSGLWDWLGMSDVDRELLAAFIDCFGDGSLEDAQNAYVGTYKDDEDFAYETVESCYNLEEPLAFYFDYERYARDLMVDHSSSNGYYFTNNW